MQNDAELEVVTKAVQDWRNVAEGRKKELRKTKEELRKAKKAVRELKHFLTMEESLSRQREILQETAEMERNGMARKMTIWRTRCVKFANLMSRMFFNGDLGPYLRE